MNNHANTTIQQCDDEQAHCIDELVDTYNEKYCACEITFTGGKACYDDQIPF